MAHRSEVVCKKRNFTIRLKKDKLKQKLEEFAQFVRTICQTCRPCEVLFYLLSCSLGYQVQINKVNTVKDTTPP